MILKIPVIYGSVRSGRQGIKAARFVERQLRDRGHDVTLIDPVDFSCRSSIACSRSTRPAPLRPCSSGSPRSIEGPTRS